MVRALQSPAALRLLFNVYPPYLMTGITVREIAPDWRRVVVDMGLHWRPGRGRVSAVFELTPAMIAAVLEATAGGEKCQPTWPVEVRDAHGTAVARVRKTLHVRRKPVA